MIRIRFLSSMIVRFHGFTIIPFADVYKRQVFVKFKKNPTKEQLIEALEKFSGVPQELGLPSAPKQFIRYLSLIHI